MRKRRRYRYESKEIQIFEDGKVEVGKWHEARIETDKPVVWPRVLVSIEVHREIEGEVVHWLGPAKSYPEETAEECIRVLVGEERIWAFGERTPGRKRIKPGDRMCFYATGRGVVAHARVASRPEKKPHPKVHRSEKYPWVLLLDNTALYLDEPIVIDADVRAELDVFQDRDPNRPWGWFVQATRTITEHDFGILTRGQANS